MKYKAISTLAALAVSCVAYCGECTYSFSFMKNSSESPVTVPLSLREGKGGFTYQGFASAVGADLRVKSSDGTVLPHEIETWDPSGRSIVWVRLPSVSKDTELTLSWGNASAASAGSSPWSSSEIVMHFNGDAPAFSVPSGTAISGLTEAQSRVPGPLGDARRFHDVPTSPRLHVPEFELSKDKISAFTVSFWWKTDKIGGGNQYLFQLFSNTSSKTKEFTVFVNERKKILTYSQLHTGDLMQGVGVDIVDYGWHHYAFVYDGETMTVYKDGHTVGETTLTSELDSSEDTWQITFGSSKTPGAPAYGTMDEFRMDLAGRSAESIRAECELQSLLSIDDNEVTVAYPDCPVDAAAPLADFPLFLPIRSVDAGCYAPEYLMAQLADGDARVYSEDGTTAYPYEAEYLYGERSAAGLWVKVPSFSSNTVLKVRSVGKHYVPDESAAPEATGEVWNPDEYLFVNHISPTGGRTDSVHGINFRPYTSLYPRRTEWSLYPPAADGPTGPYAAMNCGTTTVAHASGVTLDGVALTNVFTISWWMRQDDYATVTRADGARYIAFFESDDAGKQKSLMIGGPNGEHTIYLSPVPTGCGLTVPDAGWHHYAYVSDGKVLRKYLDGVDRTTATINPFDFNMSDFSGKTICLGNSALGAQYGTAGLRGGIDEFRLETVARSSEWIAAMYATQRAYIDGVGYGYAPEFAEGVAVDETDASFEFSASLSCRTSARCWFCWGTADGGDRRSAWENAIDLGSKNHGAVAADLPVANGETVVYGRFFAENSRGTDSTRTVCVRRDEAGLWSCPIRVNYSGDEPLADFPVAVSFPSTVGLPSSGARLRILDASGRSVPFEVETWNPSGTSVVWVRVPELSGDVELTATWRKGSEDDGTVWPSSEVWGDEFKRVYHFGDGLVDSSMAGNDLANAGSSVSGTGKLGGGVSFGESGAALSGGGPKDFNDFSGGFTISLWANLAQGGLQRLAAFSSGDRSIIVDYGTNGADVVSLGLEGFYLTAKSGSEGGFNATLGRVALTEKSAIARADGWRHYAWTSDGTWFRTYRDGELLSSVLMPMTLGGGIPETRKMTASFGGPLDLRFTGSLDEVRVENTARSAAWIAAHHANMSGGMVVLGEVIRPGLKITVR